MPQIGLRKIPLFWTNRPANGKNRLEQTMFEPPPSVASETLLSEEGEFGLFRRFLGLVVQNSDRIFRQPKPFW
jgi:hypothetical protein